MRSTFTPKNKLSMRVVCHGFCRLASADFERDSGIARANARCVLENI
jgi:hypothetical protein